MTPGILPYAIKDHKILRLEGEWDPRYKVQLEEQVRSLFKGSNKVAVEFGDNLQISSVCMDSILEVFRGNIMTPGVKMGLIGGKVKDLTRDYGTLPFPEYGSIDEYKKVFRLG